MLAHRGPAFFFLMTEHFGRCPRSSSLNPQELNSYSSFIRSPLHCRYPSLSIPSPLFRVFSLLRGTQAYLVVNPDGQFSFISSRLSAKLIVLENLQEQLRRRFFCLNQMTMEKLGWKPFQATLVLSTLRPLTLGLGLATLLATFLAICDLWDCIVNS